MRLSDFGAKLVFVGLVVWFPLFLGMMGWILWQFLTPWLAL